MAIFNTYRTISRILVQLITTISRSVWPEISRLYGAEKYSEIKKISRRGTFWVGLASSFLAVVLFVFSDWILNKWTLGKIHHEPVLMAFFLMTTVVTAFWQLPTVVTMATNKHERLSVFYLCASIGTLALAVCLSIFTKEYAFVISLFFFEVVMLITSHYFSNKVLDKQEV